MNTHSVRADLLDRLPRRDDLPWREMQAAVEDLARCRAALVKAAERVHAAADVIRERHGLLIVASDWPEPGDPPMMDVEP